MIEKRIIQLSRQNIKKSAILFEIYLAACEHIYLTQKSENPIIRNNNLRILTRIFLDLFGLDEPKSSETITYTDDKIIKSRIISLIKSNKSEKLTVLSSNCVIPNLNELIILLTNNPNLKTKSTLIKFMMQIIRNILYLESKVKNIKFNTPQRILDIKTNYPIFRNNVKRISTINMLMVFKKQYEISPIPYVIKNNTIHLNFDVKFRQKILGFLYWYSGMIYSQKSKIF